MPKQVCEVEACAGCPLREKFPHNNFVPPRVGDGLRLAVGEAPGAEEAQAGEPFVGASGSWLRGRPGEDGRRSGGLYAKAGVRDHELTFINTIQCRPPDNVYPDAPEARSYISATDGKRAVAHCILAHVLPLLESRPWKRIDLFGAKALAYIAGKLDGINRWRGSPIEVDTDTIRERMLALQKD